ncbi:MAG: hypothetical protein IKM35_08060 [Bacteroidaceae bacterium]|nr:hypothetical protein [Bacteroidaceae bacterium]
MAIENNVPQTENNIPQQPKKSHPIVKWFRNIGCVILLLLFLALGIFVYWKYYSVFGEGVKSGTLNYVVLKGDIFKTYEGKLIMEGVVSSGQGQIESNHFTFSIEDKELAERLMRMSGERVELQYKEYHGTLPWRGHSVYVVDSILSNEGVQEPVQSTEQTIIEAVSTSI